MTNELLKEPLIYRNNPRLYVVIGFFASIFIVGGFVIGFRRGDWSFLAQMAGATAVLFLLLRVLRLEIRTDGFKYRNLTGSRKVEFADVSRAYLNVVRAEAVPQGVAVFWVERKDGSKVKINLRTFPVEAAAILVTALESHGIHVEVPDASAAQQFEKQVRAAHLELGISSAKQHKSKVP
jgi:hypothetical protein